MEQLTFELAAPEPPSFANFLPGRNAEVVASLARLAAGELRETGVLVWGGPGSGRTHLLVATVAAARVPPDEGEGGRDRQQREDRHGGIARVTLHGCAPGWRGPRGDEGS